MEYDASQKTKSPVAVKASVPGGEMVKPGMMLRKRMKEVSDKFRTQAQFARDLKVSESRITEYLSGKRSPSGESLIKLGRLAIELGLPEPFFFWERAGVSRQDLRSMAHLVLRGASDLVGEAVPVRRFRETTKGRSEAGPPLLLPAEFVPNPMATECIWVDEEATAIMDAPRGLVILDTSVRGVQNLAALWGSVVLLRYEGPLGPRDQWPAGIYMGRLELVAEPGQRRSPEFAAVSGWLNLLSRRGRYREIYLGKYVEGSGMDGVSFDDTEGWYRRMEEVKHRAARRLSLLPGLRVMGLVIGRLTGHLTRESASSDKTAAPGSKGAGRNEP